MTITNVLLATIRVLWRRADTMELWGIPYDMRPGQSPRDLYMGRRIPDTLAQARGYHGATIKEPGVREDWIYLGAPGWWGHLTAEEQRTVEAFLAPLRALGLVPGGPYEWAPIQNPLSRLRCASMKVSGEGSGSIECSEPISRIDRKGYLRHSVPRPSCGRDLAPRTRRDHRPLLRFFRHTP